MYKQRDGVHSWYYAPNGTAGDAISFTQAMTLNASGNLGIGTTTPTGFSLSIGKLVDIASTGTGGATPSQLSIYNAATTNTNITARIVLGTSAASVNKDGVIFEATNDGTVTTNANQYLTISTRNAGTSAERVRVNAFGLGVGGAIPSSGTGITFPASQSASSDPQTLDDYEEGTWTPTATAATGSITAFTAEATYVKVGSVVTVRAAVKITTPGTASGALIITGYPFTSYNYTDGYRASTFLVREDNNTGVAYQGFISDNSTGGEIITMTNGAITWTANSTYVFQATYHTAF
jgi:hypothetical protein